jgi:hypothetical protein
MELDIYHHPQALSLYLGSENLGFLSFHISSEPKLINLFTINSRDLLIKDSLSELSLNKANFILFRTKSRVLSTENLRL